MSGKSTLLRTVGINAVLALAGAPVRAASLRLSPLRDRRDAAHPGLAAGGPVALLRGDHAHPRSSPTSARGPVPLLFLLDELFHGTNSHDRLIGAVGRAAQPARSRRHRPRHDARSRADRASPTTLAPRAVNVHFEDWFDGDEMRFDYRMKPGPVTRSNALAL